ncbi:gluconate 2-dehydrogenase subunit 3 family protein [Salinicoccus sp. ID82-1]|uniref:gluconate 2-dehydrogenase subunit 3 family protein n=1 Tax=Salinicoccus sp. ID82-1 TaxID=2820269 RepID=UPI001F443885|nr:gluconate 2-dehydrogenase subunit 3 family protein [Salinicoccus sp. ID82-1]MCG1010006.1 gluconate 2-dehydrogenase subunit 3 family protein [Salinicoccus sp. ID82-1]
MSNKETEKSFSRRNFLKMSGVATGTLVTGTYLGSLLKDDTSSEIQQTEVQDQEAHQPESDDATQNFNHAFKYFQHKDEFQTIEAAAERIFPEDDNGPGATTLGVAWFIDHELAGGYGANAREYMKGPFKQGTDYQGPQYALIRRDIFAEGIRVMNAEAQSRHEMAFFDLEGEQMDEILTEMQNNELEMKGIKSNDFFEELRLATLSGAYADPLYGGNKGMKSWDMKKFPGAYMSYANEIETEGFVEKDPQPLSSHISH